MCRTLSLWVACKLMDNAQVRTTQMSKLTSTPNIAGFLTHMIKVAERLEATILPSSCMRLNVKNRSTSMALSGQLTSTTHALDSLIKY